MHGYDPPGQFLSVDIRHDDPQSQPVPAIQLQFEDNQDERLCHLHWIDSWWFFLCHSDLVSQLFFGPGGPGMYDGRWDGHDGHRFMKWIGHVG